ncbi:MAG: hypothetical protein Q9216_002321 [Gyalolechia sp. 2 TL-2023]
MDPASAISLLAGIHSLVEGAFELISLINTIKNGGKQRVRLLSEVNCLWIVLKLLESHFDPEEQEQAMSAEWLGTIQVLEQDGGVFDQISAVFDSLTHRLQPMTGHRKIRQSLQWPLDKPEVGEYVKQLERLKSTLNLAYNSSNAATVRQIQGDTTYIKRSVADIISKTREGTGAWFIQSTQFRRWISSPKATIWCPGIMGAGKTYLASIAVEHLKSISEGRNRAVLVVYCHYDEANNQSVDRFIAALIKQVVQIRPDDNEQLNKLRIESSRAGIFPSLQKLTTILREELAKFDISFIVIDGLDEMIEESERRNLLESLSHGNVNIMFTSRHLDSIGNLLTFSDKACRNGCDIVSSRCMFVCQQCPGYQLCEHCHGKRPSCPEAGHHFKKVLRIMEKIEMQATPADIRSYIEWTIDHEPKLVASIRKKPELREEILMNLMQQSSSMFLLTKLHLDSLATKRTPRAIQLGLQDLLTEIDNIYEQTIKRIQATNESDRKIAMNFLLWVTFSGRPLSVAEIEHASSITVGSNGIDQDAIINTNELISMCAGLVMVDVKNKVRLAHFSAHGYLWGHRDRWFPNGHAQLTRACLTYLSYHGVDSGRHSDTGERESFKREIPRYPLIDYIGAYWGYHAQHASAEESSLELDNQMSQDARKGLHWLRIIFMTCLPSYSSPSEPGGQSSQQAIGKEIIMA